MKVEIKKEQQTMIDSLPTKSARIRYLDLEGYTRGQIAAKLEIRYQHVRNVLITPVKNPVV